MHRWLGLKFFLDHKPFIISLTLVLGGQKEKLKSVHKENEPAEVLGIFSIDYDVFWIGPPKEYEALGTD